MSKLEMSLTHTKLRELLSLFSHHVEIPIEFGRDEVTVDFLAPDTLSHQNTRIPSSAFKTYKNPKLLFTWIDVKKLSDRTSKMVGNVKIKIVDDKIHISCGDIKRKQNLINREKPKQIFKFDKNGVPQIDDTEYDTVAEIKVPKGGIFGAEVELRFENNKVLLIQKDFDSEGEDVIGKYEATDDAEEKFTFVFYGEVLKKKSSLLDASKTKYILSSKTTNRPMSCVTVSKDFRNIILLLPINKTQEELPPEIKDMKDPDTDDGDGDDDFDLEYDEEDEETD